MWIFIKQFYVRSTFPPFLGRDRESGDWTAWWGKPGKGPRGEWEAVSWWSWFINICSDVLSCSSAVLLAWTFHDHGCLVSRWGRRRHSVRSRRQLRLGSWAMGGGRRHGFWFLVFVFFNWVNAVVPAGILAVLHGWSPWEGDKGPSSPEECLVYS